MESYEEFCSRTLNTLLLSPACSTAPQQQRAHVSNIQFHGRRLLEPVLSEELRVQMAEERHTALQRDRKRQTDALLERVHNILNNIHYESNTAELSPTLRPKTSPASVPLQNTSGSLKKETLRLLNQRLEREKNITFTSPSPDSLSPSVTGSYARLPSPQPSRSPLAHRARRSNILISCPVSANTSRCESHESELSDRQLSVISSTPVQSSLSTSPAQHEKTKPARRSPPAPLNRSYDVESPSPSLIRPQVFSPSSGSDWRELEGGFTRRPLEERMNVKHNCTTETDEQKAERLSECLGREHTQVSVEHMKSFCRLNAVARGFLTRRLLQTDKIKHLRKTVQDSREFLRSFQSDSQLKRISISYQDLSLLHRVTAQLRAALHDIHQIFFVWPVKDKLHLLQQDREIHTERTIRQTEKESGVRRILSSATQKTLERNKHRQSKTTKVMAKSSSASRSAVSVEVHRKCLSLR